MALSSRGAADLPAKTIFLRLAEPGSNLQLYLMHYLTKYS